MDPLAFLAAEVEGFRNAGTYQRLREMEGPCEARSRFDGREVINLASNNYLGLANDPRLREAAIDAVRKYGAGTGAVRTISGTLDMHMELERRIAAFKNVEACVVFQSGFTANAGTVSAVLGKEDHVISDALNHASIIDGCRLSRAKIHVFAHGDAEDAERKLSALDGVSGKKLLITDGVFSMDGDIGPLDKLVEVAERHGAIMMVDDAHASGVLGRNGRGTVDHFGLHGRVDIQVGTLSKAVGVLGGYVCGSKGLIEYLYHRGRPFLFSTSHPPAVTAACLKAFDILESEPERIARLWENTEFFKERHGAKQDADYARDGGRGGGGTRVFAPPFRGRTVRHRHRIPDRSRRQGAHTDHRDRGPYACRSGGSAGDPGSCGRGDGFAAVMGLKKSAPHADCRAWWPPGSSNVWRIWRACRTPTEVGVISRANVRGWSLRSTRF
jgi:glycine C-acetyltransferase